MFTGIVEEIGTVRLLQAAAGVTRLQIGARRALEGTAIGDSVAVNGVCLTVVAHDAETFAVEATPETLRRSNLSALAVGDGVHLERALAAGGRIGGHFVQGHVDATGTLAALRPEGDSAIATFTAPPEIMRYVVPKGSIAVDGVSLTVVDVERDRFTVALIPHTQDATLLCRRPIGAPVNLEADILAKYVERATSAHLDPALNVFQRGPGGPAKVAFSPAGGARRGRKAR
ncbi:MAG: riboflavin synthase [Chloroflexi bacterium]|nr:riboflavin synthase [Chloroflexota bacterium]